MKLGAIQHVPFETVGSIEEWADANGHALSITKIFNGDPLPALHTFDGLIVMGGPMGAYDDHRYSWLPHEKIFLQSAIREKKKILGICLGAQLIAAVLGAIVHKNPWKEIGWFPIRKTIDGHKLFSAFASPQTVFHWHGDTFEIPHNAQRFFESDGCKNQAFLYSDHVLGLQFHLELTASGLEELIQNCQNELIADHFIQLEEKLTSQYATYSSENKRILFSLLDSFFAAEKV
ncbi:MAG TPA: type 1 glutamine amidotransferase [Bacteroidota bacterium]|nr:type 1 glutamine amidotransferase [Bacteroidota bacterium]